MITMDPTRQIRKPHKYHAKRTEVDGTSFASQREATRYQELRLLERAGEIHDLKLQPSFALIVRGVIVGHYVGDFFYWDADGKPVLEDVKGVKTAIYRLKKKLVKVIYGLDILET